MKLVMNKDKGISYVRAFLHLEIALMTAKFVKTLKKSAIFYHMLFKAANFNNVSILLKENNEFKLDQK